MPCPAWLSWMVELDNPFAKAHKASEIIQMLPLSNGIRILDIGCGPGRVLLPLAKKIEDKGGHATGLDIQAEMIEKTRLKARDLNIYNIDFIKSSIVIRFCGNILYFVTCVISESQPGNSV